MNDKKCFSIINTSAVAIFSLSFFALLIIFLIKVVFPEPVVPVISMIIGEEVFII